MKKINTVFLYIALTIALCPRNVLPLCGTNEQIDDLQAALIVHESSLTLLTSLSAIPITGAALSFVQVSSSIQFAAHLREVLDEMQNSLNTTHTDHQKCSELLDKTRTATTVIKSAGVGLSFAAMIPGVGLALLPPRIATSLTAILLIRDCLEFWKNNDCVFATTRDCTL